MRSPPVLIGLTLLLHAGRAAAQAVPGIITNQLGANCDFVTGKLKPECIPRFIGFLIQQVFAFVSILFILNVIYAGFQIAKGAWDGEKSKGKDRLKWSIGGLIICASAYLILDVVLQVVLG
jgi:hypothetical protein